VAWRWRISNATDKRHETVEYAEWLDEPVKITEEDMELTNEFLDV